MMLLARIARACRLPIGWPPTVALVAAGAGALALSLLQG